MPDGNIRILNDLIATCRDSESGYGKAAKGVHADDLRDLFTGISAQRDRFAGELEELVRSLGAQPETTGHIGGALHGGWVDLEQSIRPKDDATFIEECERGDRETLNHYDRALTHELPTKARAAVERQRGDVASAIERLHHAPAGAR